jgi:hypothetical protein
VQIWSFGKRDWECGVALLFSHHSHRMPKKGCGRQAVYVNSAFKGWSRKEFGVAICPQQAKE